jgi:hypothetical protein
VEKSDILAQFRTERILLMPLKQAKESTQFQFTLAKESATAGELLKKHAAAMAPAAAAATRCGCPRKRPRYQ